MKQIKAIVATGHLDKQGEMLAPEALYGMAEQANKAYIPMWVEHDIAQPPIGRMTHAEVVQMDDGVLAVQSTREVWESSADIANIKSDGRKIDGYDDRFSPIVVDGSERQLMRHCQPPMKASCFGETRSR